MGEVGKVQTTGNLPKEPDFCRWEAFKRFLEEKVRVVSDSSSRQLCGGLTKGVRPALRLP